MRVGDIVAVTNSCPHTDYRRAATGTNFFLVGLLQQDCYGLLLVRNLSDDLIKVHNSPACRAPAVPKEAFDDLGQPL